MKPMRFKPAKPTKQVGNAFHIYSRLLKYVRSYWLLITVACFASMIYSGVDAWFIKFLQPLLNKGLVEKNHHFLHYAPFLVLGMFLLRAIFSFISDYFMSIASRSVIMRLRQDIFAHLQKLPARFYDHNTTGQVLSVLLYGVDQVANASAEVLSTAVKAIFLIIALVYVMFTISWKLTFLYFTLIPVVTIIVRMTSLYVRRMSLSIQDSVAEMSHCAEETIEGYKVVRAFEGQDYEINKFNQAARKNLQRELKIVKARSLSTSTVQLINAFAIAFTLYVATFDIKDSLLTAGGFSAMIAAMLTILKPMKDLAQVQTKLYRGLAGAQSVFEMLDEQSEVDKGTIKLQRANGRICFSNVGFNYNNEKEVLENISFEIEPGEVVALVGRSGSGKSTIVSLLTRFYDHYTGDISLDGISLREYELRDLRRQFAMVSQHVTLFHDTIANNIAYGSFHDVSKETILEAAKASHALEFIEQLPGGLDALVGENGVLLSGGQRQRIAIARAIVKDAPVLILDEATSALDTESERYIQAALEELMRSRTTLVIAHRLSTVEHADKIVVMDSGKIVEVGTHAELLAKEGYYAKLYRMQFKDVPTLLEAANNV